MNITGALNEPLRSLKTARRSHMAGHNTHAAASAANNAKLMFLCSDVSNTESILAISSCHDQSREIITARQWNAVKSHAAFPGGRGLKIFPLAEVGGRFLHN